jgi:aspartate racemase
MMIQSVRCLGLIGAPGAEESCHYARQIEDEIRWRLGKDEKPNLITLSFQPPGFSGEAVRQWLVQAVRSLKSLGAEAVVPCSSPLHLALERAELELPILSMFDPVLEAVERSGRTRIGVIGTILPEEQEMWRERIGAEKGLYPIVPSGQDVEHVRELLTREFSAGIVTETARADVFRLVEELRQAGAQATIVCAPQLTAILADGVPVAPLIDVSELHAMAAVDWLSGRRKESNHTVFVQ